MVPRPDRHAVIVLLIAVTAASALLTGVLLRYARVRGPIDQPTDRSSHAVPTPRGGGAAIVAAALTGFGAAWYAGRIPAPLAAALLGGGALVAAVGWLDDRRGVSPGARLLVHAAAAACAVGALGGLPRAGIPGMVLAGVGVMWATNLYNFMDGLDGLAASEAVTAAGAAAAILSALNQPGLAVVAATMAAAAAGFLPWNWPPARIFMGDVGSGFLGYTFGVLALAANNAGALPIPFWLVLLGVFVFDATVTVVRRALVGERVTAPHRLHAYQRLVQVGWSHRQVTSAVIGVNLLLSGLVWLVRTREVPTAGLAAGSLVILAGLYLAVERLAPFGRFRNQASPNRYK